jgi:hypothetical protein
MPKLVLANTSTAAYRRVYFDLRGSDGLTAATGEAAGQPQISTNGAAWTATGIGTLTAIGNGRYYADLTQTAVLTAGSMIETRYKSAGTIECPGDSVHVVAFDPHDSVRFGITALPNAAATTSGGLPTVGTGSNQLNVDGSGNVQADVREWVGVTPSALISGRMDSTVGAMQSAVLTSTAVATGAITATGIAADAIGASELAADAATEIAAAVWDKLRADHVVSGSFGEGSASVQGAVTGAVASVTGNVGGNVVGSVGSVTGNVGGNVGGNVTGNVGGNVTGSVGSLAAQAKADVNAEVVDVIFTDTISQLAQAQPTATPTVGTALMLLYMALRNAGTTTGSTLTIANSAGTVICKGTLSDDGTTFTKAILVAGP